MIFREKLLSEKDFVYNDDENRKRRNTSLVNNMLMSEISFPQVTCYSYYEFRFPVDCFIFP